MKFLLVASRPRCGTHWLASLIGSCPGVHAIAEEPFHRDYAGVAGFWDGKTEPERWLVDRAGGSDWCCFAAHPSHLPSHESILPACRRIVTAVAIVYRRDLLAQFVSNELARINWEWSTESGEPPTHGTLDVDLVRLREWCLFCRDSLEADKQLWADRPTVTVAYEDLVADTAAELLRVGRLTGIDTRAAAGATSRKELRPLWQVVGNYQDARGVAAELAIA